MKKIFSLLAAVLFVGSLMAETYALSTAMDTVYFVNKDNWATVKVHAWGGTAAGTAWPGLEATAAGFQLKGADVYYFAAEQGAYANCIFNNGGNGAQTANLTWTAGQFFYNGAWSTRAALEEETPVTPPTPTAMDTVYFVNKDNWATVKVHAWGGTAAGTAWPGLDATAAGFQLKGADVYYFAAEQGAYASCIFNNGGNGAQTANLTWTAGQFFYNGAWSTRAALEEETPVTPPAPATSTSLTWNVSDATQFPDATIATTTTYDGLTVLAKDDSDSHKAVISDNEVTWTDGTESINFTRRMFFNGGANAEYRAVYFTVQPGDTVEFWAQSGSSSGSSRDVKLRLGAVGNASFYTIAAAADVVKGFYVYAEGENANMYITCSSSIYFYGARVKHNPNFVYVEPVVDYYIKHPWGGGDWTFKMLTREGETDIYSIRDIYGGNGCNWKAGESGTANWIASPTLVGSPATGDSAVFAFDASAKNITITKIETAAPVDACDWTNIAFLGDGAQAGALSNKYKMCAPTAQEIVNIQQPGFATEAGIYFTFPAGITACSLAEGKYAIQGAGMVAYISAFTEEYTNFTVTCGTNVHDVTVYYVDGTTAPVVPTINYYLVGTAAENGWAADKATPMAGDSIVRHLAAGTYEFKILTTLGSWDGCLGYSAVNAECSSTGYEGSDNVKFTLAAEGDVKIKVVGGKICILGSFGQATYTSYTIAGVAALMGSAWDPADTNNDMVLNGSVYTLTKNSVVLTAGEYTYKMVANHAWSVFEVPASGNNTLTIAADGTYNVTFTYDPSATTLTAEATSISTDLEQLSTKKAIKVIENGQVIIIRDGVRYNALGQML